MLVKQHFRKTLFIPIVDVELGGELIIPSGAESLVIFAHGSGNSRFNPRNNQVAEMLQEKKIATFLFDLLSKNEDLNFSNRFNIQLMSDRLIEVTDYLSSFIETKNLNFGYFGASTGAASAINAASKMPDRIKAVVARGGRPDLANESLAQHKSPTLLIVGGLDFEVLQLNMMAYEKMNCVKKLETVESASHLFEEKGKLEHASNLAAEWFSRYC